jgi:hypothetical protein
VVGAEFFVADLVAGGADLRDHGVQILHFNGEVVDVADLGGLAFEDFEKGLIAEF